MSVSNLRTIERKVLGALMMKADSNMEVVATKKEIANWIGYKASGGAITFALRILDMNNYINVEDKNRYRVLL